MGYIRNIIKAPAKIKGNNNVSIVVKEANNSNGNRNRKILKKVKSRKGRDVPHSNIETEDGIAKDFSDPLMSVIEAHNTQVVRFNLNRNETNDDSEYGSPEKLDTSQSNKLFSMKNVLFGQSSVEKDSEFSKGLKFQNSLEDIKPQRKKETKNKILISLSKPDESKPFIEDPVTNLKICDIICKGKRAQFSTFKYTNAVKYYLDALKKLDEHNYPDSHPLKVRAVKQLNDTHHSQKSMVNSAEIVTMGLRHEDKGELVKAMKMYIIAYRIRMDAMGNGHPSLSVLLNMLGSVQVKRGQLDEAMSIYKLALYGNLDDNGKSSGKNEGERNVSPCTMSSTLRHMGMIYQTKGNYPDALRLYHDSLDCMMRTEKSKEKGKRVDDARIKQNNDLKAQNLCPVNAIRLIQSYSTLSSSIHTDNNSNLPSINKVSLKTIDDDCVCAEVEAYLEDTKYQMNLDTWDFHQNPSGFYNTIFQKRTTTLFTINSKLNVAMTLHRIAKIHSKNRHHDIALCAYQASLRGMNMVLDRNHPHVAAVLGDMANVLKEMKNYDEAYNMYKEVLGIETVELGIEHPESIVTLHNIGIIESCRGNYGSAVVLYNEVLNLQRSVFGSEHNSIAVTLTCLGDLHVKTGNITLAIDVFKEALWIRSKMKDSLHGDIARILHKLGILHAKLGEYIEAEDYISKSIRVYNYNNMNGSRLVEAQQDKADIQAKVALQPSKKENDYI